MKPNYTSEKPYTFHHRLAMCRAVNEGCEAEDAIMALATAASILRAWTDFESEMVLLLAEKLCRDYVVGYLLERQCTWEEYDEFDPEVFKHFTGGANKMTEEQFKTLGR